MKSKIKIYTSYWGNLKKLRKDNIMPIGISRFPPRYLKDVISDKRLAPKANMLKMPKEIFDPLYDEILNEINTCQFVENLEKISDGRDVALLCFEKPGEYCHRISVAEWITNNTGLKVYEYGYAPTQLEIF